MAKKQQFHHARETLSLTPPPPKTWTTPTYQLERYTVHRHVKTVRVELHGIQRHSKRTEAISFPLLPGVPDADFVRAAVWFSPNKWSVPFRMNVSAFHGTFATPVSPQLIQALIAPQSAATRSLQQPESSFPAAPTIAAAAPFQQFQPPLPQPGQFHQPLRPAAPTTGRGVWQWYRGRTRRTKIGLGCAALLAFLIGISLVSAAIGSTNLAATATPTPTTQQAAVLSTQGATQPAVPTAIPTNAPTHIPTPTPTPKPTPKPTLAPTHQATARPTQPPAPPTPTPCPGINCNPWGYNFSSGKLISYPPSNFCDYFNCIASFWGSDDPGDGYVVQCVDGTFSQSGGESGACSYHGGVSRPLYSH